MRTHWGNSVVRGEWAGRSLFLVSSWAVSLPKTWNRIPSNTAAVKFAPNRRNPASFAPKTPTPAAPIKKQGRSYCKKGEPPGLRLGTLPPLYQLCNGSGSHGIATNQAKAECGCTGTPDTKQRPHEGFQRTSTEPSQAGGDQKRGEHKKGNRDGISTSTQREIPPAPLRRSPLERERGAGPQGAGPRLLSLLVHAFS